MIDDVEILSDFSLYFFLNSDFKSNKEIYFETILNSAVSLDISAEYKL